MKLKEEFFARDSKIVAPDLLGKLLVREIDNKLLTGIICETEAYALENAVKTPKINGAFYKPGLIHMYASQGRYQLAVSTLAENIYNEILIRKLKPLDGIEKMKYYRKTRKEEILTNGPSKLVEALNIDTSFDSKYIIGKELWIEEFLASPRISIIGDKGNSSKDFAGLYILEE